MLARAITYVLIAALQLAGLAQAEAASSVQNEITRATLVADTDAIKAGIPFKAGVLLEPKQGWHTYWENPGDAGLPTALAWALPQDFNASGILWPAPERINEGPLTIYGYHDTVFLPATITPPATLNDSEIYKVSVKVDWLVCKDICIPESATLDMAMPVGTPTTSAQSALFAAHDKIFPKVLDETFSFTQNETNLDLSIPREALNVNNISEVQFFMRQQNAMRYNEKQAFKADAHTLNVSLIKSNADVPAALSGILSVKNNSGDAKYFDIQLKAGSGSAPTPMSSHTEAAPQDVFFPLVLAFAILGGIILNLMPCVLPVLSLKALAILKKADKHKAEVRKHGIAYTFGILVSFAVLAGFLISLQQAGEHVGWGYQMQSPIFVGFLVYLMFLVGLNLSGLFNLPVLLGNTGSALANESSARGSFFTGVLATAVATPCTAPFMASAVGVALTLPSWQAFLIFEALGFGLALPFLLISFAPALLRFLPRPGAWMETFKHILAFPMYASVIWLLWVLMLQTSISGMVIILCGLLAIFLIFWMKRMFMNHSAHDWFAAIAILGTIVFTLYQINNTEYTPSQYEHGDMSSVPYSADKLTELRAQGRSVFINATAAWCITCQVNAKTAIHTQTVMDAFKEQDITYMVADWTRQNDDISNFLKSFGYQGVPLYVFYPANNGAPVVLPQLLTPSIILETIKPTGDL